MAWTAPRTWVTAEVVTAALFNAHIRDNLLALSQHAHGGASGDGANELANLVKVTYTDAGDAPDPGSGLTVIFTVSGVVKFRAFGGAATALSVVGHGHTFVEDQIATTINTGADDAAATTGRQTEIPATTGTKDASQGVTMSEDGIIVASGSAVKSTGSDADHKQELLIDGVITTTIVNPASGLSDGHGLMNINGSRSVSSGARTSIMRLNNDDGAIWAVGRDSGVELVGVII